MIDAKYRWLLERDVDGEVSTFSDATEQGIADALATAYAALCDTLDESCIWCVGEPDRRIVEIRTFPVGRTASYGVVSTQVSNCHKTTIQADEHLLQVPAEEVLTRKQAESIFREFFHSKSLPPGFRVVEKSYLFGPGT